MIDYYCDIRFIASLEFPVPVLLSSLYSMLHQALVKQERHDIGVSFPNLGNSRFGLGDVLRLHGSQISLSQFMESNWISKGMQDYLILGKVDRVPETTTEKWAVRRVQTKSSPSRERARLMRRKGISEEQARLLIPDTSAKRLALPFVVLSSSSTGQKFHLFVSQKPSQEPLRALFNSYGLSNTGTVPRF